MFRYYISYGFAVRITYLTMLQSTPVQLVSVRDMLLNTPGKLLGDVKKK